MTRWMFMVASAVAALVGAVAVAVEPADSRGWVEPGYGRGAALVATVAARDPAVSHQPVDGREASEIASAPTARERDDTPGATQRPAAGTKTVEPPPLLEPALDDEPKPVPTAASERTPANAETAPDKPVPQDAPPAKPAARDTTLSR